MPHNPAIRNYCQQVGKFLELPAKHKRRLLNGLERELEERFSSENGLTLETIYMEGGPPEASASALMECIDEKERKQYQLRRKLLVGFIVFVLAALIVTMIAYSAYLTQYTIDHAEIRIIQNETP